MKEKIFILCKIGTDTLQSWYFFLEKHKQKIILYLKTSNNLLTYMSHWCNKRCMENDMISISWIYIDKNSPTDSVYIFKDVAISYTNA